MLGQANGIEFIGISPSSRTHCPKSFVDWTQFTSQWTHLHTSIFKHDRRLATGTSEIFSFEVNDRTISRQRGEQIE
jgi:hypothetical protein